MAQRASSTSLRRWFEPADFAAAGVGSAVVFAIEVVTLRPASLALLGTTLALFATLAWLSGAALSLSSTLASRTTTKTLQVLVRAAPSLLVTVPVGLHLFEGAKARTLPGAASAPAWFPLTLLLSLALALHVAERVVSTPRRKMAFGILLLLLAFGAEYVNRTVQRSGYFDLHTLLTVATCISIGLAARAVEAGVGRPWPAQGGRAAKLALTSGLLVCTSLALTLAWGLRNKDSRWQVATQGLHTRLFVRAIHGIFDVDGDGHASVLGGDDCDNLDGGIHPGARELPHNGVDENCDGTDDDRAAAELAAAQVRHRSEAEAWRDSPQVKAMLARTSAMNLVLISVDTLRADVLDGSSESRARYPRLWRLLDEGQRFTRAFAPSAGTDLSMTGILTGQVDPYTTLQATLAESLAAAGRRTYAVVPSEVGRYVGKAILMRGVHVYKEIVNDLHERDIGSHATSPRTTEVGLKLLDAHKLQHAHDPFFLWLHYFDVHEHDELQPQDRRVRAALGEGGVPSRVEKYRRLVTLVDEQVGTLLEEVVRRGLAANTVIVLVSDHGEGLGEDRRLPENHGRFIYNALVHVPLALRIPGFEPHVIEHPVSLLDLYPTLVELLTGQPKNVDGQSFLHHLVPGAPAALTQRHHPLPLNESDQFGVISWPYKLLVRRRENLSELYDLERDFGERVDLSAREPQRVNALLTTYGALPRVSVDRTTRGRLARDRAAARGVQSEAAGQE